MRVTVMPHGQTRYVLPGQPRRLEVEVAAGATVRDLLRLLGVPEAEIGVVAVGGKHALEEQVLQPGDEVWLLPPMDGGR